MSYIGNSPEFWNLNVNKYSYTATEGQTIFNAVYDAEVDVYLNGSKLQKNVDFTATDGVSVVLTLPAVLNDVVDINGYFNMENFDITQYDGSGSGLDADTLDGQHGSYYTANNVFAAHTANTSNPHIVTKTQVGLGSVDNTADSAKNVLSATKLTTARTIDLSGDVTGSVSFDGSANATITATVVDDSHNHIISNVDGLQTALDSKVDENVAITAGTGTKITYDTKGLITSSTTLSATDIPSLDASKITTGTIDSARLPSYVDDIIEAATLSSFPATGETGKIYVALDTNKIYRWSGSVYVYITSGAVDSVAGKTGIVSLVKADVGLGSVDNTADSVKNVLSASKLTIARTIEISGDVIGSVSFDGSENISLTASVIDDSHNHIVENVDGLQTVLDGLQTDINNRVTIYTLSKFGGEMDYALSLKAPLDSPIFTGPVSTTASFFAGNESAYSEINNDAIRVNVGNNKTEIYSDSIHINGSFVWHAGNVGSGSGLDADTLDGQHASAFAAESHTHSYLSTSGGTISGSLTVSGGVASYIYMGDSDEGDRAIHCNSNYIGFLTQAGGWGAYCDDNGNWTAAGNITAYSDKRLKENIVIVDDALNKTLKLSGVYYNMIDDINKVRKIGVIAQDVREIIPEVILEHDDGILSVDYGNITALLIEAIKELKLEIEQLKKG